MNPETMPNPVPAASNGPSLPALPGAPRDLVPDLSKFVIEDGKPVESTFAEKLMRLLTEPLYCSWSGPGAGRTWQVFANVGLFYAEDLPPLVPDVMLGVDIRTGGDLSERRNRSYFSWDRRKHPAVVIEIVSGLRGREEDFKQDEYAKIGVPFYVIFDPENRLRKGILRCYMNCGSTYQLLEEPRFPTIGLGLVLWHGTFEGHTAVWLRWCDQDGKVIPTGEERAEQERQLREQEQQRADQAQQQAEQEQERAEQEHERAEQERQRAEQEHERAEQERQRADDEQRKREQLEARLRALGVEPNDAG